MYFLHIVLLVNTIQAIDIEIAGEVAFDLKISNLDLGHGIQRLREYGHKNINKDLRHKKVGRHLKHKNIGKDLMMRSNGTVAPILECAYQYPEQKQIDAMLSNMMNQLTKVFVRARAFIKRSNPRRMHANRFSVVEKKNTTFFENIYNNMTQEYKKFYNSTTSHVVRSGRDPCTHQDEIKHIWLELLDAATLTLRRASLRCVEEYLKYNSVPDAKLKRQLEQFLLQELDKIRSYQLTMLCETFQLCYGELL